MTLTLSPVLIVLGAIAAFLLGIAMAIWTRRPIIARLEGDSHALQAQLDGCVREASAAQREKEALESELVDARRELAAGARKNEQLRDLIKIHVARRREFDEWAGPIKASLGEAVGQALRTLQDQLARQASVLQRQEKLVAQTQDQYRAKSDEIERMRRELSIKNYHIAALNERFIRIEERIGDLSIQVSQTRPASHAADSSAHPPHGADRAQATAPQMPLDIGEKPAEDWTQLLDEWHKRLDRRFSQLDALEADLQGRTDNTQPDKTRAPAASDGPDSPAIR